jgi:uncharacterized protein (TIGR03086 family)
MVGSDRRRTLELSYENAAVIVSGIGVEELGQPTPCPGYDVAGLIDHLVEAGHRVAALGRGQAPPAGDESPHVELSDAPAQLRRAGVEATQAWGDDLRLSSTFTMPWGEEYTGATLIDMYVVELAAHAWDLARATGQLDELDPSLAAPALSGARTTIKPSYRNLVEPGSPFGAEVQPRPDASHWERFAAFMGRDPRAALDWSGKGADDG